MTAKALGELLTGFARVFGCCAYLFYRKRTNTNAYCELGEY